MADFEIRPFIPKRAGDNVHFAVVIEIAVIRPFAPELVGQLQFIECVQRVSRIMRATSDGGKKQRKRQPAIFHILE